MAKIVFTSRLADVGPAEEVTYEGTSVMAVLDAASGEFPRLRSYILDDQDRVRKHVAIFVDGTLQPRDRVLDMPVSADTSIYVMQALSGG